MRTAASVDDHPDDCPCKDWRHASLPRRWADLALRASHLQSHAAEGNDLELAEALGDVVIACVERQLEVNDCEQR